MKTIIKLLVLAAIVTLFIWPSLIKIPWSDSTNENIASTDSVISINNTKVIESEEVVPKRDESFQTFLKKFTSSAKFQYSRIIFPLGKLTMRKGNDYEVPYTKELYFLADEKAFSLRNDEKSISRFTTINESKMKFEDVGQSTNYSKIYYFETRDHKWYLVSGSYSRSKLSNYSTIENEATVHNAEFLKKHP